MRVRRTAAAVVLLLALCAGCHRKHRTVARQLPQTPRPAAGTAPEVRVGYTEQGVASWYGIPYHGRPAADGEIYNMETLVAAHRVMPFNTWVRVTNLKNLKTVEVRVIDRGPFVDGRIIDLSKAAARQIDLLGPGIGPVRLEVISAPAGLTANDLYAVQLGSFTVYANAERLRSEADARFGSAQIAVKEGDTPQYRVLAGKWHSEAEAQRTVSRLESEGKKAFVVRLDQTVPGAAADTQP